MSTFWCERAVVGRADEPGVVITTDGDRISGVETGVNQAPADATRLAGLTLPGFANAHSHAFHRALRGRTHAGTGSFWTWREQMYRAARKLHPDNYYALARATYGEMAMAGITAVGEFHYVHHQTDGTPYASPNAMGDALIAAAADAGIRITLLDTLYLHGGLGADGYLDPSPEQIRFCDGSFESWEARVESLSAPPHALIGAAAHSVRAVDPAAIKSLAQWAGTKDAPVHVHLSEQPGENEQCATAHGYTPSVLVHDCGLLEANATVVHATHLTADDISILGMSSTCACICPTTERDLADGIGPTAALSKAGSPLCLGSDSHAVIDMFEEARALELDERLASLTRGTHSAASLLTAATSAGHASLGWPDAGVIAVGGLADLVTVDMQSERTAGTPGSDGVLFSATAADIADVVVGGRTVVAAGRHVDMDVSAELHQSISELMDR